MGSGHRAGIYGLLGVILMEYRERLEETDLYSDIKDKLGVLIPADIKSVLREIRENPNGSLWLEIGKALRLISYLRKGR